MRKGIVNDEVIGNKYLFPFCRKMEICENMWKFSVKEGSRSAHIIYSIKTPV